ncbi:MAG: CocE/NonD family hydrolase, partial [Kordiimonas sp.]
MRILAVLLMSAVGCLTVAASAQDFSKYSKEALREFIWEEAVAEKKRLVQMRDGVGLSTNIYYPKNVTQSLPAILWRTPYNFNELSLEQLRNIARAVSKGYVYILQNERGRYFSEGDFEALLGRPRTDGYDMLTWIADQEWSNGKVGTLGCSSSAEWQLALAAMDHPAHAAMVPMGAGSGIGRVGQFYSQGNLYRGGAMRDVYTAYLYELDNPLRALVPTGLSQKTRAHIGEYNDLEVRKKEVDWAKHIWDLPLKKILSNLGEPKGLFENFIEKKPNDPAWYEGGLFHDNETWGVPSLWFNSWYDLSISPNIALYNHAKKTAVDNTVRDNQYLVIAPTPHCDFDLLGPDTIVGERYMGDTSFEVDAMVMAWFDRWLKDDVTAFGTEVPTVQYYNMGKNKWQAGDSFPPQNQQSVRLYLHSNGKANSLYGDGKLSAERPIGSQPSDHYVYDPMNPVQTIGGGECCNGGLVEPGAMDQRLIEARHDVLVYTSEPLENPLEVTGFIDAVLYVSSDVLDTDFTLKLVDVAPD